MRQFDKSFQLDSVSFEVQMKATFMPNKLFLLRYGIWDFQGLEETNFLDRLHNVYAHVHESLLMR
jgi:hypothetical protein